MKSNAPRLEAISNYICGCNTVWLCTLQYAYMVFVQLYRHQAQVYGAGECTSDRAVTQHFSCPSPATQGTTHRQATGP